MHVVVYCLPSIKQFGMTAILCAGFYAELLGKQIETFLPCAEILCNRGRLKMASSKEAKPFAAWPDEPTHRN